MKLSSSVLLVAFSAMNAIVVRGQSSSTNGGSTVQIEVKCHGIDTNQLDSVSSTVMGQVLEESYTESHKSQTTDSFLKVAEDSNWRCGNLCSDDDKIDPRKKAKKRRPPPSLEENFVETAIEGVYFDGFWNCDNLTFPEVDSVERTVQCSTSSRNGNMRGNEEKVDAVIIDMKKWETLFLQSLIDTRRIDFRAITDCTIHMNAGVATSV